MGAAHRRSRTASRPTCAAWFADDPARVERLTFTAADLYVDLSKNLVDDEVLAALLALADEVGLTERRDAMFARRAHQRHRGPGGAPHRAAAARPTPRSRSTARTSSPTSTRCCARVYDFAERVRSGEWTGVTGERIRTVVNIGIGGSDLGPVMAYEALEPYGRTGLECRFISNIDPTDAAQTLAGLDPATTLFIVSSKTFGTLETLTNARLCKAWLLDGLPATGADDGRGGRQALRRGLDRARQGRRPSGSTPPTPSASGTGSAAATRWTRRSAPRWSSPIGPERFAELLAGMHAMDEHFRTHRPGAQRAGADGAAQRLVRQLPRRRRPTPCCPTRSCCTGSRRTSSS